MVADPAQDNVAALPLAAAGVLNSVIAAAAMLEDDRQVRRARLPGRARGRRRRMRGRRHELDRQHHGRGVHRHDRPITRSRSRWGPHGPGTVPPPRVPRARGRHRPRPVGRDLRDAFVRDDMHAMGHPRPRPHGHERNRDGDGHGHGQASRRPPLRPSLPRSHDPAPRGSDRHGQAQARLPANSPHCARWPVT